MPEITPTAVKAAMARTDQDEHDAVAGQVVCNLAITRGMVADLAPREWEELAAYLFGQLEHAPVRDSPAFAPHRIVLGALASELRGYAQQAGEPVGLQVDLRAATTKAEERRIRERIDAEAMAFHEHIDVVIDSHRAQQELAAPETEEEPIDQAEPAAEPTETDDALAYL